MLLDCDRAVGTEMTGEKLIVIARDINDAGAFARLAQHLLNHVVVFLRPMKTAAQGPDVDQIAHDVERFELIFSEKREERSGVAPPCPEMDVGNPGGTITVRAIDDHVALLSKRRRAGKSSIVTFLRQAAGSAANFQA